MASSSPRASAKRRWTVLRIGVRSRLSQPVSEVRVRDLNPPSWPTMEGRITRSDCETMWSHSKGESRSRIKNTRGPDGPLEMTVRLS